MKSKAVHLVFSVTASEEGMTLLSFLRAHCKEAPSIKAIKRAIDGKYCKVNGAVEQFSSHPLKKGDKISINPIAFHSKSDSKPFLLSVLYEDASLLICNKPPGVISASQGALILVHRLDKETSGALIFAKSPEIKEKMVVIFQQHQVKKVYLALVDGCIEQKSGEITNYLGKTGGYQGQTVYGAVSPAKGKKAITVWKLLKKGKKASAVQMEPITGRTHQLRVHLSQMGHPILGDAQYGKRFRCAFHPQRHLLHAYAITFPHPVTERELKVIAPIPLDFKEALSAVGIAL